MLRVNIFSGEVCLTAGGIDLPGPIPLHIVQSYSSGSRYRGLFGPGWSTGLDLAMTEEGSTQILWMRGSEVHRFTRGQAAEESIFSAVGVNHGYKVWSANEKRTYHFLRLFQVGWGYQPSRTSGAVVLHWNETRPAMSIPSSTVGADIWNRVCRRRGESGRFETLGPTTSEPCAPRM